MQRWTRTIRRGWLHGSVGDRSLTGTLPLAGPRGALVLNDSRQLCVYNAYSCRCSVLASNTAVITDRRTISCLSASEITTVWRYRKSIIIIVSLQICRIIRWTRKLIHCAIRQDPVWCAAERPVNSADVNMCSIDNMAFKVHSKAGS